MAITKEQKLTLSTCKLINILFYNRRKRKNIFCSYPALKIKNAGTIRRFLYLQVMKLFNFKNLPAAHVLFNGFCF